MAIFNEAFIDNLMILNEKKTREEYRRRAAEKHFKFEPDKPGSKDGTITDKKGKKYRIEHDKYMEISDKNGKKTKAKKETESYVTDKNSMININSDIYRLKGSNKGERIKAAIEHEIGHQNLHNFNPNNKTVDPKNRNIETFRRLAVSSGLKPTDPNYHKMLSKYLGDQSSEKDAKEDRLKDLKAAKKYEDGRSDHTKAEEFEADRFAANRTSERAVRNMIKNTYRNQEKDIKNNRVSSSVDKEKSIRYGNIDKAQRLKALKDEEIRNGKSYK